MFYVSKVGKSVVGITELPRHVCCSAARIGDRQFVIGADAVDPGFHLRGIDDTSRSGGGARTGDAFGFPCEAGFLVGFDASGVGRLVHVTIIGGRRRVLKCDVSDFGLV